MTSTDERTLCVRCEAVIVPRTVAGPWGRAVEMTEVGPMHPECARRARNARHDRERSTTRYAWLDVMGIPYHGIDVLETSDQRMLVDEPTLEGMYESFEQAEILPEPDHLDSLSRILSVPRRDVDSQPWRDVTDLYGGWDAAQTMREDPDGT